MTRLDWFLVWLYAALGVFLLAVGEWNLTAAGGIPAAGVVLVVLSPVQFTLAIHKAVTTSRRREPPIMAYYRGS